MNKKVLSVSMTLLMASSALLPVTVVNAATSDSGFSDNGSSVIQGYVEDPGETYYISNEEIFNAMEKQGVDVKSILTPAEYNSALNQDMLRQGSNWLKRYTYKGHKRITVGVNSAIVKLMKYGGQGGTYAIETLLKLRGMPMDPGAAAGIHGTLSSINATRGHWWHIDLKSHKVVANGNQ